MRERVSRVAATLVAKRPVKIVPDKPTVTISFDDAPASACRLGARLAEDAGVRANYYISGALTGTHHDCGFTIEDLHRLHGAGHELCSHGFAHLNYRDHTSDALRKDIAQNAAFFRENGLPETRHFAFPHGAASPRAKAICAEMFETCRGIQPGIMQNRVDRALLFAVPLYAGRWNLAECRTQLERLSRSGGWLVFYTHKVTEDPGPYDATPKMLLDLFGMTDELGIPIRTISDALSALTVS